MLIYADMRQITNTDMNPSNPIVSIIIPTKNSSKALEQCLASVKTQTYINREIIVIDNNSTDPTQEIAKKYTDKVFNKGPERSAQRNFGASQSKGEYLLIIDSDMVLSEKVVENCVAKIKTNNCIKGVIIPEESFGQGFWAQCKKLERSFYLDIDWMEGARFFCKNDFLNAGGYDEKMISGEDWDLSRRIEKNGRIDRIDDLIYHNEGKIKLIQTIRKKMFYAGKFTDYADKNQDDEKFKKQTSILNRYKLFFSKPIKLLRNPILGIGMLIMKTCEFAFGGVGYLIKKLN
jgi:glycosyltransferase involved in cell wall biosynthesis